MHRSLRTLSILALAIACFLPGLAAQEPAPAPPILTLDAVEKELGLVTSLRARLLALRETPRFREICLAMQGGLDEALRLTTDMQVETLKAHLTQQLTSVLGDQISPLGPDRDLAKKWTDELNGVLGELSQNAQNFEQWVAAVNRAKAALAQAAGAAEHPAAALAGTQPGAPPPAPMGVAPVVPMPVVPQAAGPELDPQAHQEKIESLVRQYVVEKVKEHAFFGETAAQVANNLAAVVEKFGMAPADDVSQVPAITADAQAAFGGVLVTLQPVPRKVWEGAREEFHRQLDAHRFAQKTTGQWRAIYSATAKGLALAATKRQAVAAQIGAGFWKKSADRNGATYWDERFDASAEMLATRMDAVADNAALNDARTILTQLVKESDEFLAAIDNPQVPEKRVAWRDLMLFWREQLVTARQTGAFDPADPEALKTAIRESAKDLRQAGKDWTEARNIAAKNAGAARGSASAAAAAAGSGTGYYGTSHAARHHARAMARIHARHSIRSARYGGP